MKARDFDTGVCRRTAQLFARCPIQFTHVDDLEATFRDMHAERDYLVKRVFPELRQRLKQFVDETSLFDTTRRFAPFSRSSEMCGTDWGDLAVIQSLRRQVFG